MACDADGAMTEPPAKQQFQVKKFSDVGASEEFVASVLELIDILNATMIFGEQRAEVSGSIGTIAAEALPAAFLELRKIRSSGGQDLPILNHLQMYEDFYGKLWKAYKEYMQRAAKAMGFDTGFLFQKDRSFEDGLKSFRQNSGIQRRSHFGVSHGSHSLSRSSCAGRRSICRIPAASCRCRHRHVTRLTTDGGISSSEAFSQESD